MSRLDRIIKRGLCLGCGLCEAEGKSYGYNMIISEKGFYIPKFPKQRVKEVEDRICKICPAINLRSIDSKKVWGEYKQILTASAIDDKIRFQASSGGVVSAVSLYLIEKKIVDAILHVGVDDNSFIHNSLKVSFSKENIVKNATSRYAPALIFDKLHYILENSGNTYCFIGKPCDIKALKVFLEEYPHYQQRIKFTIAIFCAGIPSYDATNDLIKESKSIQKPVAIQYRGSGWPGNFKVVFDDKSEFSVPYTYSWGKVLKRKICYRCKICPDGIGLKADIAVGDAWDTVDGYPDFKEKDGRNFVLLRNDKAVTIFTEAIDDNYIQGERFDSSMIQLMQPYQYERRISVVYKLLPVFILTGNLLSLDVVGCIKLAKSYPIFKGMRMLVGSIKRFILNGYE